MPHSVSVYPHPSDDAVLVARMAQGDPHALAALYDRHSPSLMGLAVRMLESREEAEDLLHDVFLEAWRASSQYVPARGSVRAWLVTRMRSRVVDRLRTRAFRAAATRREEGTEPVVMHAADVTLISDWDRLREAVKGLPAEQRRVLELGYFEGLSSTEIAARMRTPLGTVKSRVAAGLARLREALADSRGGP